MPKAHEDISLGDVNAFVMKFKAGNLPCYEQTCLCGCNDVCVCVCVVLKIVTFLEVVAQRLMKCLFQIFLVLYSDVLDLVMKI